LLIARKTPALSSIFNATVKVIFLGTPRRDISELPPELSKDTLHNGSSHSPRGYFGTGLSQYDPESLSKAFEKSLPACHLKLQQKIPEIVREISYPSPFSEPGSEVLLPLKNGKYIGIAGIPATLVPMTGNYHNTLIHVLRSVTVTNHASSPQSSNKQFPIDVHSLTSPTRAETNEWLDRDSQKSTFNDSYHWSQIDSSNSLLALIGDIGRFYRNGSAVSDFFKLAGIYTLYKSQ
jgi:hypothetical protein